MKFFKPALAISALALTSLGGVAMAESDVSHNWSAENEVEAMAIFRDKYVELGGEWKETAFPDTEASISSVKTRFIGGKPPMALQSALGGTLLEFAGAGLLQDMSELANSEGWASRLSAGMDEIGQFDGAWVAAPVFVDVINWMYTNNDVLAANGIEPPTTWDEFTGSLATLQDAGIIPIAIGGDSWQEAILFDHVLLAVGGAALYNAVMAHDADAISGDDMTKVLEEFVALGQYTDEGRSGRSWNDTNTLVLSDKAAYFFMGPWASGGYGDMGDEGGRWSCNLTPWSDALTIVADGFQFIKVEDEADMAAQNLFAQAVMDPYTQFAAAIAKGTLPAAVGADPSTFGACPSKAVAAMENGTVVTHWNGHAADTATAIKDTVSALWNGTTDVAGAQAMLAEKMN